MSDENEQEKPINLALVEDPDLFEVGVSQTPGADGVVLLFKKEHAFVFRGDALAKLLASIDILIHRVLPSPSLEAGEIPETPKKVTLH